MKLRFLIPILLALAPAALAQNTSGEGIQQVSASPTGACTVVSRMQYNYVAGSFWGCKNGTWTQVSSGGGSMTWPAASGITVCSGTPCTAWGTSLTAPIGAFVGAGQANTYTTGLQDFSLATVKLPATATVGSSTITLPGSTSTLATLGANTFTGSQTIGTTLLDPVNGFKGPIIACVATPGNTTGPYQSLCDVPSTGVLYACKNAAGCTVAADWTSVQGSSAVDVVCDGTDKTSAINSAITGKSPGGTVQLSAGTCVLSGSGIVMGTAGVILAGMGNAATILSAPVGAAVNGITVSAADMGIRDLAVDGLYTSQTCGTQKGIVLSGAAHRLWVSRVWVKNTCDDGLFSQSGDQDVTIANSMFTNLAVAASQVQASPAPTTTTFSVFPGMGQNFKAGQSLLIGAQAGTVLSVSTDSITLTSAITAPTAGQVVAIAGGYQRAIWFLGAPRPRVIHNYVTGWTMAVGINSGSTDILVSGNTLINNYGYYDTAHSTGFENAINIVTISGAVDGSIVSDNRVSGTTNSGIAVNPGSSNLTLKANVIRNWAATSGITGHPSAGVYIQGTTSQHVTNVSIIGGSIEAPAVAGSLGVNLVGGFVYGVRAQGVNFSGLGSGIAANDSMAVIANAFDACGVGVIVNAGSYGTISGNEFTNATGASGQITLSSPSAGWVVSGNSIIGANTGISDFSSSASITGNTVTAAVQAIDLNAAADAVVQGNILATTTGGFTGVRVRTGSLRNKILNNVIMQASGATTVVIADSSDYTQVLNNTFPNSTVVGGNITMSSTGTHNQIAPNCSNSICNSWPLPTVSSGGSVVTGSNDRAGTLSSTTTGTWTPVLTFTAGGANTGWNCTYNNLTTPSTAMLQTASATGTATASGTTASGDQIRYSCIPW